MSTMAPVLPGMKAGWPRGTAPMDKDSKEVKNPSLTLNRQVNLYPLTNYTFGTKGNPKVTSSYHLCVECFSQLSFDSEVYTKSSTATDFVYISESNESWEKHSTQR